mmetsp:Transcript_35242/g.104258  ORF Transcript_35242/g.104258 Transcript_35242/m.104258 type:complete len:87 (+) Transcript_35242:205-465(+)
MMLQRASESSKKWPRVLHNVSLSEMLMLIRGSRFCHVSHLWSSWRLLLLLPPKAPELHDSVAHKSPNSYAGHMESLEALQPLDLFG